MKPSVPALVLAALCVASACKEPPRANSKAPAKPEANTAASAPSTAPEPKGAAPVESAASPGTAGHPTASETNGTDWRVAPKDTTDMAAYIKQELAAATADKRTLVVYVGATWCEPCKRFHDAVDAGKLNEVFPDVRFLEFDADVHRKPIVSAGYASKYIPLFSLPGDDGRSQGKHIMGAVKGDGAVPFIVPKLKALLASN